MLAFKVIHNIVHEESIQHIIIFGIDMKLACCLFCSIEQKQRDSYLQRILSVCDSRFDLNECTTEENGTVLHVAAKHGLTESAREILSQGYSNMLLEPHGDEINSWPLAYAVKAREWSTVKVILETLSDG